MDGTRFDSIIRTLGDASSRRSLIGLLAGLAAAPLATDARSRKRKPAPEGPCGNGSRKDNTCSKDSDCGTSVCNTAAGQKNLDGKGRCRCVRKNGACSEDKNCCGGRACVDDICGSPAPSCNATTCPDGCCSTPSTCVSYTQQDDSVCAAAGASCAPCNLGTACSGYGTCDPIPCSVACTIGCCTGETCNVPSMDNACGLNGAACVDCTLTSKVCDGTGQCVLP